MSDLIDKANAAAETARLAAISEITQRQTLPQLLIAGVVACVDCVEPISKKRLKHMPSAALCVACQEERELDEKRYGC